MSLSKLNHDSFLSVLAQLSTSRKLAFRQVNSEWCTLLEGQLSRRTSLTILAKHAYPHSFSHTVESFRSTVFSISEPISLDVESFADGRFLPILSRLYPKIRKFQYFFLWHSNENTLQTIIAALTTWQRTLTVVALSSVYHPSSAFWFALSNLSNLRHLHLGNMSCSCAKESQLKSIFNRIETFSMRTVFDLPFSYFADKVRELGIDGDIISTLVPLLPVCASVQILRPFCKHPQKYLYIQSSNPTDSFHHFVRAFPSLKKIIIQKESQVAGNIIRQSFFSNLATHLGVEYVEV